MAPRGSVARAALLAAALARAAAAGEPSCGLGEACGPQDVEAVEEASVDALRVELLQTRGRLLPARSAAEPSTEEQPTDISLGTLGKEQGAEYDDPSLDAEGTCLGSGLGMLITSHAPGCLPACPSLCPHAIPAIAWALEDSSSARWALCTSRAALACALGAEACASVLAQRPPTLSAAGSPSELEALCSGYDDAAAAPLKHQQRGLLEFAAGALARRGGTGREDPPAVSMEESLENKPVFPPCEDKNEGRNCMPPNGSEYSNSTVYCTARKYKLPGSTIDFCPVLSRCYGWPAECDDPFCRNGDADRGDGQYCHRGEIVRCSGDNAPDTEDSCTDRRFQVSEGCTSVQERHCVQQGEEFFCGDGGTRLEGDCWGNDNGNRRRWDNGNRRRNDYYGNNYYGD